MKILIATIFLSINILFANAGEIYKAPSFKIKSSKKNSVNFNKNWEEDSHYKIKDSPENERTIASDPQEEKVKPLDIKKRDPSSISKIKSNEVKVEAKVHGWDLLPTLEN